MRISPSLRIAAIAALCVTSASASAQVIGDPWAAERAAARRELHLANVASRNYWQIEYPRQRRELYAAIRLTEAEIRVYKERLREYRPFDKFSVGRPLLLPIQDLKMCLLEAELRLDDLRHQRNDLIRFHADHGRLLDLRAAEARARVIELEGGEVIEIGESADGRLELRR